jgi:reactive intermediate/imine deaminase
MTAKREIITTSEAPAAIGTYSQAVRVRDTIYLSGQIALDPGTMALVSDDVGEQIHQVFRNLAAVAAAAVGTLNDCVKLSVYLTDLGHFSLVNEVMAQYLEEPYPARAAIGISALPKGAWWRSTAS